MKIMKKTLFGLLTLPLVLCFPSPAAVNDSIVQLTAEARNLPLISPTDLPKAGGTFWTTGFLKISS
jgi:hypothetical protein